FVPPDPRRPETGKVSAGIDPAVEYVTRAEDLRDRPSVRPQESPLGLGYRVPLVIASPWTRGGCVCSEVFDHTSPIRFVESWLTRKLGREIKETNISEWRRVVCGDLTSAFQGEGDFADATLAAATREKVVEGIHQSRLQPVPSGIKPLTSEELA